MKLLAIDPGASPTLCLLYAEKGKKLAADFFEADETSAIVRVNGKDRRECSAGMLARIIRECAPECAFLEKAIPHPNEGVSSVFRYARAYGICDGVTTALGIPLQLVPPQVWRKALHIPDGKDGARFAAASMVPHMADRFKLAKDHNRADAFLLAVYGFREVLQNSGEKS